MLDVEHKLKNNYQLLNLATFADANLMFRIGEEKRCSE